MRKGVANDTGQLSSVIRKNPFTIEEAFRIDGETCLYDAMKLNERLDRLSWKENVSTRGNFVWEGGERDTRVVWQPASNGKWEVVKLFSDETMSNRTTKRGDLWYPNNQLFVIGVDPIDHNTTEDGRRSDGAMCVKQKYSAIDESETYNDSFVCVYRHRPDNVAVFYEDVLKTAVYYGCSILFENNKIGLMHYFNDRGYGNFLMWLPDRAQPGIAASPKTHQYIAELTEAYINQSVERVFFKDLLKDWLDFNLESTTKFDLAMASGYALIGDQAKVMKKENKVREIKDYFRSHKVRK